jgi:hypothetical protein
MANQGEKLLYAINPDGTLKWNFKTDNSIGSSPTIGSDGTIYVGSYDGYLYAINPDGTLKWKLQTDNPIKSSPVLDDTGILYIGSGNKKILAVYTSSGKIADSPWPMLHHDKKHTGKITETSVNLPISSENSTSANFTYSLVKGWNLIGTSYPIDITIFNKAEIISVWKYSGNCWLFWSPNQHLMDIASLYGLLPLSNIDAGSGFWILTSESVTLEVPIKN